MKVSIVIPFCNNYGSIDELFKRLEMVSHNDIFNNHSLELVLVEDGSTDDTYNKLREVVEGFIQIPCQLVKLTRNFGSYNAFLAGISHSEGDCCVYLHSDLQDPPELIPELFENYLKGHSLVLANRVDREDKNMFSTIYHYLVRKYALRNAPVGGFDLVLFDKKIRDELVEISEINTNGVYLINWLGYPYVSIPYKRVLRKHGESQWSFWKKVGLFVDTFFSFSNLPIVLIRFAFLFSILFFLVALFLLVLDFSIVKLVLLCTSSLFLFIGAMALIISEYLDRIHETVRGRPSFVVEKISSSLKKE